MSKKKTIRLLLVYTIILSIFTLIAYQLIKITTVDQAYLSNELKRRTVRHKTVTHPRKTILDRSGERLADNYLSQMLWVDPTQLSLDEYTLDKIATIAVLPVEKVKEKIVNSSKKYIEIAHSLNLSSGERHWMDLTPGIGYKETNKRVYPHGESISQLIGFTNRNQDGVEGLELEYNALLKPQSESLRLLKDPKGRVLEQTRLSGFDQSVLTLSIDILLQQTLFKMAQNALEKYKAESISILVVDTQTGEILANVNCPSFDPNKPITNYGINHTNRIATETYEPGSTLKPLAIYPALYTNSVNPDSIIDIENGQKMIQSINIKDVGLPQDKLSLRNVIQRSSNVGIVNITSEYNANDLYELYESIGFGTKTNVGFPGEKSGLLSYLTFNTDLGKAFASLGYGLEITMLQLAQSFVIVANSGMKTPLTYIKRSKPIDQKRILDEDTAQQLNDLMINVVKNGTGRKAQVKGVDVAGKTGTSQLQALGEYIDEFTTSFVGYAPAENYQPKRLVVVLVRKPSQPYQFGSQSAAPLFADAMSVALKRLEQPDVVRAINM